MELAILKKTFNGELANSNLEVFNHKNLTQGEVNQTYMIKGIDTEEDGMKDFLFTLGCFEGENITVISVLSENYIIHVKDARYSIDCDLAKAILI